jgi:hypothetical protein
LEFSRNPGAIMPERDRREETVSRLKGQSRQKKWEGGGGEGIELGGFPSPHSLAQGGEGGKECNWWYVSAKRVP